MKLIFWILLTLLLVGLLVYGLLPSEIKAKIPINLGATNVKPSELTALTTADDNDLLIINDTSATATKSITIANLFGKQVYAYISATTTSALAEGSNLYWTQNRFYTAFIATTTTALSEGTNLYFTDARVGLYITGSSTLPSFLYVNLLTGNNTFTGLNTFSGGILVSASSTFTATTSIGASSVTNGALRLNGVNYAFPSADGSRNQFLSTNGSGALSWANPNLILASTSVGIVSATTENTLMATTSIPANTLGAGNAIRVKIIVTDFDLDQISKNVVLRLKYGSAVATLTLANDASSDALVNGTGILEGNIMAAGATNSQLLTLTASIGNATFPDSAVDSKTAVGSAVSGGIVDSTAAQNLVLTAQSSGGGITIQGVIIEVIR